MHNNQLSHSLQIVQSPTRAPHHLVSHQVSPIIALRHSSPSEVSPTSKMALT